MEASTVYYTDFRCPVGTSLTEKLRRLCIAAGIKNMLPENVMTVRITVDSDTARTFEIE